MTTEKKQVLLSADEARKRAALVADANRLVNETAAVSLIAAVDRGESIAPVDTPRLELVPAYDTQGHLYDAQLADMLAAAAHESFALGVRKLVALGFNVAATVREGGPSGAGNRAAVRRTCHIEGLRLSFANAEELDDTRLAVPVLQGVVLPPAAAWRRRAATSRAVQQMERSVLAKVAQNVEAGAMSCRIKTRELSNAPLPPDHASRLLDALRARGFNADFTESGSTLRLFWDG